MEIDHAQKLKKTGLTSRNWTDLSISLDERQIKESRAGWQSLLSSRLRAVPLRSVTSKFGRTGESELTERGTGERREEEGLPSLLNQTCSGNSAHERRQLVKNKLICHLISNNSASICRALNPHGFLSRSNVCFSS